MRTMLTYFTKNNAGLVSVNSMVSVLGEILTANNKPQSVLVGGERDTIDWAVFAGDRADYLKSLAASKFLESTNDVLVLIDGDTLFDAGQVMELATKALKSNAITGVLTSQGVGTGVDGQSQGDVEVQVGTDSVVPMYRLGSRLLAIPKDALKDIRGKCVQSGLLVRCRAPNGDLMYDFFRPLAVKHPKMPDVQEYLGDGWAFSERARQAGVKLQAWAKPLVGVDGLFSFTVAHGMQAKR